MREVVDDRRPAEERRPLQGDGDAAADGVVLVLTGAQVQLAPEPLGQGEGEALVRPGPAEALAPRLAVVELGRSVWPIHGSGRRGGDV